jgi:hypothetical protein
LWRVVPRTSENIEEKFEKSTEIREEEAEKSIGN